MISTVELPETEEEITCFILEHVQSEDFDLASYYIETVTGMPVSDAYDKHSQYLTYYLKFFSWVENIIVQFPHLFTYKIGKVADGSIYHIFLGKSIVVSRVFISSGNGGTILHKSLIDAIESNLTLNNSKEGS